MPGVLGVIDWNGGAVSGAFNNGLAVMRRPGLTVESLVAETQGFALGRTHLDIFQPAPQLVSAASVQVLLDGELTNLAELATLAKVPADRPQPAVVASVYQELGTSGLKKLRGSYCAVVVDAERDEAFLLADSLGSHPIYWATRGSRLLFASELSALVRLCPERTALDPRAVADYIAFGFVTGNRTLARSLSLVGPGSIVRWGRMGVGEIERHVRSTDFFERRDQSRPKYTGRVVEAFTAAVQRAISDPGPHGLSLSGGLDSRAILSALGDSAKGIATYTLGVSGCADEVIAARLSDLTGTRHSTFVLDARYLTSFLGNLREMVRLTDGMYLSHGLTEMLALGFLRNASFRVLLRGHCGELAKTRLAWPLHTDDTVYALGTTHELIDHLLARSSHISGEVPWLDLFTPQWRSQMMDAGRSSLEEALTDVELSPPDLCAYLYLHEHHRRFTVPSLELFRNAVEVRLPFADEDFLRVLLSGAPAWRDRTDLHRAIVAHAKPALLRVRDSNTGVPLDAGRLWTLLGDKLNSALKRLNVPGYRHYHNFDDWMGRMLIESVEGELLGARALDRGLVDRERLRGLLDGARRGVRGYAYLLQVLLILELWQQENVDAHA